MNWNSPSELNFEINNKRKVLFYSLSFLLRIALVMKTLTLEYNICWSTSTFMWNTFHIHRKINQFVYEKRKGKTSRERKGKVLKVRRRFLIFQPNWYLPPLRKKAGEWEENGREKRAWENQERGNIKRNLGKIILFIYFLIWHSTRSVTVTNIYFWSYTKTLQIG